MNEFTYPFHTAYTQARELYGVELNPDEFETLGMTAWSRIGNKQTALYRIAVEPEQVDTCVWAVDLPCNADIIESVTADYEDYQKTTPMNLPGNNPSGWIEGYTESRKYNTNQLYPSGKYIKYTREENRLWLADRFETVNILYKGVLVDATGLPSLDEKEIDAIATYFAYTSMFKKALVTKDQATMQLAAILENMWKTKCTQARVPDYINQNEMDEILNALSSWDRKRFGKSFKPIH